MIGAEAAPDPAADARRPRRQRTLQRARGIAISTPLLAVVIALVTWPGLPLIPGAGLDPSWQVALQLATHRGLDWGTQIAFTYGPLGFLSQPLTMYGGLSALSAIYAVLALVGVAAAYLWAGRRHGLPLVAAFVVALVASAFGNLFDAVVPIVFIVCAVALSEDAPPRVAPIVVYGGAVVAAIESLVKLNSGLAIVATVAITVVAMPGPRGANFGRFAATFVAAFAALWFATGQGIGNFDDYLRTSFEVVSGYSAAMAVDEAASWPIAVGLVLIAATIAASWLATSWLSRGARAGVLLITAILCFGAWKEGFVRYQVGGHMVTFFFWMLAPWIAVVLGPRPRWRWVGLAGFAATAVLFVVASHYQFGHRVNPIDNARTAVDQVHQLLDPAARARARDEAREADAAVYGIDHRTLREIGDRTVDVYPWDASLAWTFDLNWDPVPVFQSYSAYTPYLDRLNADALSAPDGPQRILRHQTDLSAAGATTVAGVDGRYAPYDTPAATLAMLCHYRAIRTTGSYQLLARTADRCGAPRRLGTVETGYGEAVNVPRPRRGELVFAKVSGLTPSGIENLRTVLYRAAFRYVVFDGSAAYRIVGANAGDGLVLAAAPGVDFPRKWAMAPDARTVSFEKQSTWASPANTLRLSFYEMPVRPAS